MTKPLCCLAAAALLALPLALAGRGADPADAAPFPDFRAQEVEKGLGIGYAVLVVDLNGDGKKDIVVVDRTRVLWYENPTWTRHTILEGQTKPDNVCIAALDIDGDGRLDFALGADWGTLNTRDGGTLQWLRQGRTPDEWTVHPIDSEPTIHRIRFADVDGDGKPELVVAPLMGRNGTKENNWMDGSPVRVRAYHIPKDPVHDRWVPEVLDESMHVVHNFYPVPAEGRKGVDLLTASYEGVGLLQRDPAGKWTRREVGAGNQDNPKGSRGSSEVKEGKLRGGQKYIATIEPWHGDQVVVYTPGSDPGQLWHRHVLDGDLKWGHAVWCADLDGDGDEELIVGVRDNKSDQPGERRGVRVYKALDERGERWARLIVEDGGVAVEDLAAADLNGDGRIDLVAVGRQTHNLRIYWNEGKK